MDRYELMTSRDIKAEVERLRGEISRPDRSAALDDAAHQRIDLGLDELRRRGDLK